MNRLLKIVVTASVLAALGGCVATDDYARAKLIKLEAKVEALEKQMDGGKKPEGRNNNPQPPGGGHGGGGSLPPPPK